MSTTCTVRYNIPLPAYCWQTRRPAHLRGQGCTPRSRFLFSLTLWTPEVAGDNEVLVTFFPFTKLFLCLTARSSKARKYANNCYFFRIFKKICCNRWQSFLFCLCLRGSVCEWLTASRARNFSFLLFLTTMVPMDQHKSYLQRSCFIVYMGFYHSGWSSKKINNLYWTFVVFYYSLQILFFNLTERLVDDASCPWTFDRPSIPLKQNA